MLAHTLALPNAPVVLTTHESFFTTLTLVVAETRCLHLKGSLQYCHIIFIRAHNDSWKSQERQTHISAVLLKWDTVGLQMQPLKDATPELGQSLCYAYLEYSLMTYMMI